MMMITMIVSAHWQSQLSSPDDCYWLFVDKPAFEANRLNIVLPLNSLVSIASLSKEHLNLSISL